MENPEKSQNKGGTNTAEGCGRHRAAFCRVLVDECGG